MKIFRLLTYVVALALLIVKINSAPSIQYHDDSDYESAYDLSYFGKEPHEDDTNLLPSISIESDASEEVVNEDQYRKEPSSDSHSRQKRDCQRRRDCLDQCKWIICMTRGCGGAKVGCITSCLARIRC